MIEHSTRKHSKFSASGAERWENCPGSVELSEGIPDKDTPWAIEGTKAHEVLEATLLHERDLKKFPAHLKDRPKEMFDYAKRAADFIVDLAISAPGVVLVETRISLAFIHPDAFGTFDAAVIDHFGTLHVFDYKYGAGHAVAANNNPQMAFYGMGLAHKYNWNFKRVRHWIIQPRIKGYDGPIFWEIPIMELKTKWVNRFRRAVERVETQPRHYVEGSWCHWCKAKKICPLKEASKLEKAKQIFKPIEGEIYGNESEDWVIESEDFSEEKSFKEELKSAYQNKEKSSAKTGSKKEVSKENDFY